MQKDAIFRAFSMTKPLVSVLTLIMMEEGLLQLADPIDKYLPSLNNFFLYDAQNENNKPKRNRDVSSGFAVIFDFRIAFSKKLKTSRKK